MFAHRRFRLFSALFVLSGLVGSPAGWSQTAPPLPVIPSNSFNVTNYGAVGDGLTTNTAAIQSAINAASTAGGGTVEIPAGTFLSGPLTMKNSINLQIETGAMLQMLPYGSYPTNGGSPADFITASSVHDVEITGSGTIDGQGAAWWAVYNTVSRPYAMFGPSSCTRVLIQGVTLQNPPNTHIAFNGTCNDVTIQGITINTSSSSPNTDGIDLSATNCLIENCSISDGDDNIAVGGSSPMGNILVANCAFGNGHGMSVGSITSGGLNYMTVSNCTFNGTVAGIRLKSYRGAGGLVQNLTYCDLTMTNVQYPINISSYYPDSSRPDPVSSDSGQAVTGTTPFWQNITISNLTAVGASGGGTYGDYFSIWGLPEAPVANVNLIGVKISSQIGFGIYNATNIAFYGNPQITAKSGPELLEYNATVFTNASLAIITQPSNQVVTAGSPATFTISAFGTSALHYQWYFNTGNILAGATNTSFIITNTLATNAGIYSVVVTNLSGSITSAPATLTVNVTSPTNTSAQNIFVALLTSSASSSTMSMAPPVGCNYSAAAPVAGTTWNTVGLGLLVGTNSTAGSTTILYSNLSLTASSGSNTAATLSISYYSAVTTGTRTQPTKAAGEDTIQPGGVMADAWRNYYNGNGNSFTFTIFGLSNSTPYDLYIEGGTTTAGQGAGVALAAANILGSNPGSAVTANSTANSDGSYGSLFTTNGAGGYQLMPQGTTWTVLHSQPDASGNISFVFNGSGAAAYLNGFQIIAPSSRPTAAFHGISLAAGGVQLSYSGTTNQNYRIWATTNPALTPVTNTWTLLTNGTFTGGLSSFEDNQFTNFSERFYLITVP